MRTDLNYPNRVRAGVVLVGLLCLGSALLQLRDVMSMGFGSIGKDDVSNIEKRFAPLREALPPHSVVGYISDIEVEPEALRVTSLEPVSLRAVKERLLAQYALYPVIVEMGTAHEYVIGNFHTQEPDTQSATLHRLTRVKDYGNGVILFRGERH